MGAVIAPSLPRETKRIILCQIKAPFQDIGTYTIRATNVSDLGVTIHPLVGGAFFIPIHPLYNQEEDVVVEIETHMGTTKLKPTKFLVENRELLGILVVNGETFVGMPVADETKKGRKDPANWIEG